MNSIVFVCVALVSILSFTTVSGDHICPNGGNRFCHESCVMMGHEKGGYCNFIHVCRCQGEGRAEERFPFKSTEPPTTTTFEPDPSTTYVDRIAEIFARHTTTPDPNAPPTKSLYDIVFGDDQNPTFTFFQPSFGFNRDDDK